MLGVLVLSPNILSPRIASEEYFLVEVRKFVLPKLGEKKEAKTVSLDPISSYIRRSSWKARQQCYFNWRWRA